MSLTHTRNVGGGPLRCVVWLCFNLKVAVTTEKRGHGVVADARQQSDLHTDEHGFHIRPFFFTLSRTPNHYVTLHVPPS